MTSRAESGLAALAALLLATLPATLTVLVLLILLTFASALAALLSACLVLAALLTTLATLLVLVVLIFLLGHCSLLGSGGQNSRHRRPFRSRRPAANKNLELMTFSDCSRRQCSADELGHTISLIPVGHAVGTET